MQISAEKLSAFSFTQEDLNTKSNSLVDTIEQYQNSKNLTVAEKEQLESIVDKIDAFEPQLDEEGKVSYIEFKTHENLLKEQQKEFNLLRNAIYKRELSSKNRQEVIDSFEYLDTLEKEVNKKNSKGEYLRPRNKSLFRAHSIETYKPVPHKSGVGTYVHPQTKKTFYKASSARKASKSSPYVKDFEIIDEYKKASKAWKICRNASSLDVTPSMLEHLNSTNVVKALEEGYVLFESARAKKKQNKKEAK